MNVGSEGPKDVAWPVSIKGVVGWGGRYVVLRNDRDEWELPGGRLEPTDASPQEALAREVQEELGLVVAVGDLIDSWIYDVGAKRVLILTYECSAADPGELTHSDEHSGVAALSLGELATAASCSPPELPPRYLASIRQDYARRRARGS